MSAVYRFYNINDGIDWRASIGRLRGSHLGISSRNVLSSKSRHNYFYHFCFYIGRKIGKNLIKTGKESALFSLNVNDGNDIKWLFDGCTGAKKQVRKYAIGCIKSGIYHQFINDFGPHHCKEVSFILSIYEREIKMAVRTKENDSEKKALVNLFYETNPLFVVTETGDLIWL